MSYSDFLPNLRDTAGNISERQASGFEAGEQTLMTQTRRILLINNGTPMREVIQLCLETVAGWEVLTADLGIEEIVKFEIQRIDVILLDLDMMMSDIYWHGILQQLQNRPALRHIPVILLTASIQSSQEPSKFTALGVKAVLAKPFDLLTLAGQVAAVLDWNH